MHDEHDPSPKIVACGSVFRPPGLTASLHRPAAQAPGASGSGSPAREPSTTIEQIHFVCFEPRVRRAYEAALARDG